MSNSHLELSQFWKGYEAFPTPEVPYTEQTMNTVKNLVTAVKLESANENPKTATTAVRFDQDKTDWSLLPMEALEEVVKVLEFGARKYDRNNWRRGEGFKYSRVFNSLLRHAYAWWRGEDRDPESGYSHLAHMGCNIVFLLYYNRYKERFKNDDRYHQ